MGVGRNWSWLVGLSLLACAACAGGPGTSSAEGPPGTPSASAPAPSGVPGESLVRFERRTRLPSARTGGAAVAADGRLLVVTKSKDRDPANTRILAVPPDGGAANEWSPQGTARGAEALAVAPGGEVYVSGCEGVRVHDAQGRLLRRWGSEGSGPGQFGALERCWGSTFIALDGAGDVYVSDEGNARVQKFDAAGRFLLAWGRRGTGPGQFDLVGGLSVDARGEVYVADPVPPNARVQVFDGKGRLLRSWGSAGSGPGQFRNNLHLLADRRGHVFVADTENHRIQVFDEQGAFLGAWGSRGTGAGQFVYPGGLALGRAGRLHVAEEEGNTSVSTFALLPPLR